MFSGGDLVHIELGSVTHHEILEQRVHLLDLLTEFGPVLFGIFAEHGDGPLVLSGSLLLKPYAVSRQHVMEVG